MRCEFFDDMSMSQLRPLVGVWRHEDLTCTPGKYRVVFCMDDEWGALSSDAVCDDFGDLVPVPK